MNHSDSPYKNTVLQHGTDDDQLDLMRLLGILIDHKWLVSGVAAAFAVVGLIYTTLAAPIYRADALVQVEQKAGSVPGLSDLGGMFGGESKASTEIELIRSRTVIGKAVDKLRLDIHVHPVRMPIVGEWFARDFQPAAANEPAPARFGFDNYAWGGERLEL